MGYTEHMDTSLKESLAKVFKGKIADDEATLRSYSTDTSLFLVRPKAVAFPEGVEDIRALVKFAKEHSAEGVSLTCRSGGTDMSGGDLGESVIVDMKSLNKIERVMDGYCVTEPGVFYRDFEKATLAKGLLLPSFPASREICTVGGMVANNSGGEMTLRYGKTEKYVKELHVVLDDGNEYVFAPLDRQGLEEKMKLDTREGKLYRDVFELLESKYEAIQSAKPKVSKNSAGYALWNAWDRKTFDMTQLITGSQGTLGIITKISFRLIKPKPHAAVLVMFLESEKNLGKIITEVLKDDPETFESYDDNTLKLALKFLPGFVKLLGANIVSLGIKFFPEFLMLLRGGLPKLVLLAEFTADSPEEAVSIAQRAQIRLGGMNIRMRIAKTRKEAEKYFVVRRESFNLLRKHVKGKRTAAFIDDIIVQPEYLPEFLPKLNSLVDNYRKYLTYTVAGHMGDGNFHIIPLMDLSSKDAREAIPELANKTYDLVLQYHGSITAEHNDGIIRTPYLRQMYGEEICMLFNALKDAFDPSRIFNPGKKVGGTLEYAISHLVQES